MKDLFQVEVSERNGLPVLSYRFDEREWERLQRTLLGKTILFTDNDDWSDADIVRGYRGQHEVESAFRCMKDPMHISLRPQRHWTDQKIEVHVFYCVLALALCSLLQRELDRKGLHRSIAEILDQLGRIHEVGVLFPPPPGKKTPIVKPTLSHMSDEQRALCQALGLERHLSRQVIQR
ncbi:MAG: hypothetical protein AB1486_32300 [Planctomycetota bacterium]